MTASIPLARKSSTLRSRAAAFCGSAGTTRIFANGPSSPKARAAWRKTAGSAKRKISGVWARTAGPKVSVCQPFTTTTARAMALRSGELKMKGGGWVPAAERGLKTSNPTSSSSGRLRATYLRCWRTKKPCSSKYSRTIVSLTAAIGSCQRRGAKRGFVQGPLDRRRRHLYTPADLADVFSEHELDFTSLDFLVEAQGRQEPGAPRTPQLDARGQARGREELPDPFHVTGREAGEFGGKVGGDDLADGNRFAVKIFSVAGNGLDGMANGVAEVQNFAQPGLGFVLADDLRLDGTAAFDHDLQQFGIEFEQLRQGRPGIAARAGRGECPGRTEPAAADERRRRGSCRPEYSRRLCRRPSCPPGRAKSWALAGTGCRANRWLPQSRRRHPPRRRRGRR